MSRRQPTVSGAEVRYILGRFYALPRAAQLQVFAALREYLSAEDVIETEEDRAIRLRAESLEVMSRVAAHYRLAAGVAPTAKQWRTSPTEVTEGWSATRVRPGLGPLPFRHRCLPRGADDQRRGASEHGAPERQAPSGHEEEFAGVQRWLDSHPASELMTDYEEFVKEQNAAIDEGRFDARPLRVARHLAEELGIDFPDIVAVVRGEKTLADARDETRRRRLDGIGNALGFIGVSHGCQHRRLHRGTSRSWRANQGFPPRSCGLVGAALGSSATWRRTATAGQCPSVRRTRCRHRHHRRDGRAPRLHRRHGCHRNAPPSAPHAPPPEQDLN